MVYFRLSSLGSSLSQGYCVAFLGKTLSHSNSTSYLIAFTQVNKWVPADLILKVTLWWTSTPSWGMGGWGRSRNMASLTETRNHTTKALEIWTTLGPNEDLSPPHENAAYIENWTLLKHSDKNNENHLRIFARHHIHLKAFYMVQFVGLTRFGPSKFTMLLFVSPISFAMNCPELRCQKLGQFSCIVIFLWHLSQNGPKWS